MSEAVISPKVFNINKSAEAYKNSPLFLGEDSGLFDTVNKRYPKIWDLYKEMKSLDWSEDEFDYTQCLIDFKQCPPDVAEAMIETLAWQWEADTIASRQMIQIMAPVVSSSELWAAYQRISDNEVVHAATYSEIVRMSFDKPDEVVKKILSLKESFARLQVVAKVFEETSRMVLEYGLGQRTSDDNDLYDQLLLLVCTMLMLERIQFMASFAITFSICGTGLFQPIGKAVQKIAQDELEVHVELGKEVIRTERRTARGKAAFARIADRVSEVFNAVMASELEWTERTLGKRALIGITVESASKWALYAGGDVVSILPFIKTDYKFPKQNPMPYMENWLNMNKIQGAPQEQDIPAYKVGIIVNDDQDKTFEVDF